MSDVFSVNDTTRYGQFTLSASPNFKFGDIKVGGQFFFTGGSIGMALNADSTDYDKTALAGFHFNAYVQHVGIAGKPKLGVDYLSGDDASTEDVEGWAPSYGTNHKFYGWMDYFYVGNGHGGGNQRSAGLMDIYLKTAFPVGKSKLVGHLHYFASTADRTGSDGEDYSGGLGTELDLVWVKKLADGVVLKVGYSQMFGITETMKVLKTGSPDTEIEGLQNWAWAMINFTPKFL